MNYIDDQNPYASPGADSALAPAAWAAEDARRAFVQRTYLHLSGALVLFSLILAAVFTLTPAPLLQQTVGLMFGSKFGWLIVIGLLMGAQYMANAFTQAENSVSMQYLGLGFYTVAQAAVFVPLLYVANQMDPKILPTAGVLTGVIFGGLTLLVFVTRSDFSGIGRYLWLGGLVLMGIVVAGMFFNFSLGLWFTGAAIGLAAGYILYDTSNVLHHYRTDQHVVASLALFSSVTALLWDIIVLLMKLNRRN